MESHNGGRYWQVVGILRGSSAQAWLYNEFLFFQVILVFIGMTGIILLAFDISSFTSRDNLVICFVKSF